MLTKEVAEGMHALAQPLAALQARLELALYKATTVEDHRHAMEMALEDVQRTLDLMTYVRELNHLQEPAGDVENLPVSPLIQEVLADLQCLFQESGSRVLFCDADVLTSVTMSRNRLQQALFYALTALHSLSTTGSTIRVSVKNGAQGARFEALSTPSHDSDEGRRGDPASGKLPDPALRALTLTEIIVKNANGRFLFSRSPLQVAIVFPASTSEASVARTHTSQVVSSELTQ